MYTEIKTFEDAAQKLGIDSTQQPDVSSLPEILQKHIVARWKLAIIAAAINDLWKPEWTSSSQFKYWPWFYFDEGSSGFVFADSGYAFTHRTRVSVPAFAFLPERCRITTGNSSSNCTMKHCNNH